MAYTIKKAPHIQDEVTIQDEHGGTDLELHVDIYVDDILELIDPVRARLAAAQASVAELKRSGAGARELDKANLALKEATLELFRLIFGLEQTDSLIGYYGGRMISALADFLPYISEVILPEVQKAQKDLADRYKAWNR